MGSNDASGLVNFISGFDLLSGAQSHYLNNDDECLANQILKNIFHCNFTEFHHN